MRRSYRIALTHCGANSIYAITDIHRVALHKYARELVEIDNPEILDWATIPSVYKRERSSPLNHNVQARVKVTRISNVGLFSASSVGFQIVHVQLGDHPSLAILEADALLIHRISAVDVIQVVNTLGSRVEISHVQPKPSSDERSLSGVNGLDEFPFHTDGAHMRRPPRFVGLHCLETGVATASTRLLALRMLRLDASERSTLERDLYISTGGRGRFLSSILDKNGMHYDRQCMKLVSPRGRSQEVLASAIKRSKVYEHEWFNGELLLWDNSRVLHGRSAVSAVDVHQKRTLVRYSIWL